MKANKIVPVKFQLRRATASEWSGSNPILKEGEPALESDTNRVKYGNEVSFYNQLPYTSNLVRLISGELILLDNLCGRIKGLGFKKKLVWGL